MLEQESVGLGRGVVELVDNDVVERAKLADMATCATPQNESTNRRFP